MKPLTVFLAVLAFSLVTIQTRAADLPGSNLPTADSSPLTGVQFDDKPLILPVQRNFQMAMLTSSSELGRSCGNMEAYGWRMGQNEQGRVNGIFTATTDRLRALGYTVAPQKLSSVSSDVTLFTADKPNAHFIFLWSAGELGLVMTLCESTAPVATSYRPAPGVPSVQIFPVPSELAATPRSQPTSSSANDNGFTPLGEWRGGYSCEQGFTGGSIQITHILGKEFEGTFKFYPTPKNPDAHAGAYYIYGEYDRNTHRILINPSKWIERPPHYFNTVIVGGFDPVNNSFSGTFEGISGCTSFEAQRVGKPFTDFGADAHGRKGAVRAEKHVPVRKPLKKPAHKVVRKAKAAPQAKAVKQVPLSAIMTPPPAAAPASTTAPATAPAATAAPTASASPDAPMIATPSVAPATSNGIAVGSSGK